MRRKTWKVRITGLVSRLRGDGARVAVPTGDYTMLEADSGAYELSSADLSFSLTLVEVSTYAHERQLKIEGPWP